MKKLILPALRTFLIGAVAFGVLLFIPAWTLNYWQAWVFIVVFMVSANATGIYLSLNDPELLERRKKVGPAAEERMAQKIIVWITLVGCVALLVFPALDHRFGWSPVPVYVSLVGDALVALGLLIDLFVLRENSYSGSTIQTLEGQKVISTGLFGWVRHPMYSGVLVMCAGVPLALDSYLPGATYSEQVPRGTGWWGLSLLALIVPVLIWRILDEEQALKQGLLEYTEYTQKVRYRLVPHVW